MRVLFINPTWRKRKGNVWRRIASVTPPLGLAWMAAVLERDGHTVRILDAHAEAVTPERVPGRLRELGRFDLVGITATTSLIGTALDLARAARDELPRARIVLGGVHPTVLPEEVLGEPAVDVVVRGEGEETIRELAQGRDLAAIDGISYREAGRATLHTRGRVCHTKDRALIGDLDALPLPAYHLLPMDRYRPATGAYRRLPGTSMLATRGCHGRCTFCYRIFGNRLRVRSGRRVAEEAKHLQDRYGIREVAFYDDTFTVSRREVLAFCRAVRDLGLDLSWSCFSRVDAVSEDLLGAMKEAGCHQVMYGLEAASPLILRNIRKSTDLAQAEAAVAATRKAGIEVRATFMLGNPGETRQTLRETLAFALRLNPDLAVFNITTPFPGTEMFAWARARGHLNSEDWEDYDLAHSVLELPTIGSGEVQAFYRTAYQRFYLRPSYVAMRARRIRSVSDLAAAVRGLRAIAGL